jgi:hypothetical protein
MDCVDHEGGAVIAYWTSLAWRGMALTWHSVTRFAADGSHTAHTSVRPCDAPAVGRGTIIWKAPRLRCGFTMSPIQPTMAPVSLLDGVEWTCVAPASSVSVTLPGTGPVHGTGYAERIVMRVPPWQLGIHQLRWGRWISLDASRSAVWIGWTGDAPRTLVFVDGQGATNALIADDNIDGGGAALALGKRRVLLDRALSRTLGRMPMLKAAVPRSLLALRETKWLRNGTLRVGRAPPIAGTAIDEVAVFA